MYSVHAHTIYGGTIRGWGDNLWRRRLSGGPSMEAIVSLGGPTMATKFALDSPGGPILGGPSVA